MEKTPKTKKSSRRRKGESKKGSSASKVPLSEKTSNEVTSKEVVQDIETTPAKTPKPMAPSTSSSQPDEYKTFEWFYHYRFADNEQCVGWGSPQDSSPISESKRKALCNTSYSPISDNVMMTRKATRKLLNSSELDFASELMALAEKIGAANELSKKVPSPDSPRDKNGESKNDKSDLVITFSQDRDIALMDTQILKESCKNPTVPNLDLVEKIHSDSFSSLFDDDELFNEYFVHCTQEIEEKLTKNLKNCNTEQAVCSEVSSPSRLRSGKSPKVLKYSTPKSAKKTRPLNLNTTPRRICTNINDVQSTNPIPLQENDLSTTLKKTPRVGNKNYVVSKCRTPKYFIDGRMVGSASKNTFSDRKSNLLVGAKSKGSSSSGTDIDVSEFADDSLEAVLQTFVDDDLELLSQATDSPASHISSSSFGKQLQLNVNKRLHQSPGSASKRSLQKNKTYPQICRSGQNGVYHIQNKVLGPNNSLQSESVGQTKTKSFTCFPKNPRIPSNSAQPPKSIIETENSLNLTTIDDGNFFEEDVLHFLDTVESSCTSSSPPLQCTPEEIEKKKQEAKQKLEKKRQTTLVGKSKFTMNLSSRQLCRPLHSKNK